MFGGILALFCIQMNTAAGSPHDWDHGCEFAGSRLAPWRRLCLELHSMAGPLVQPAKSLGGSRIAWCFLGGRRTIQERWSPYS